MEDVSTNPETYIVLPQEQQAAFNKLLEELLGEHLPTTPTERFLVLEMARAQWRLARFSLFETSLLQNDHVEGVADLYSKFTGSACQGMMRYESGARRAFYQAFRQLQALRATPKKKPAAPEPPVCKTNPSRPPMPVHLERELASHRRRNPLFDPELDRSECSRELQRFLERHPHHGRPIPAFVEH